jgi:hypothetical protein
VHPSAIAFESTHATEGFKSWAVDHALEEPMVTAQQIAIWEQERESGETEVGRCKATEHVPGTEVVDREFGPTSFGDAEYWSTLTDGETVRATCARCGVPLEVSLRVRVPLKGRRR